MPSDRGQNHATSCDGAFAWLTLFQKILKHPQFPGESGSSVPQSLSSNPHNVSVTGSDMSCLTLEIADTGHSPA